MAEDRDVGKARNGAARAEFYRLAALETDDCVVWPFGKAKSGGYGVLNVIENGRRRAAHVHVLALTARVGSAPSPGIYATHRPVVCHNPACMNYRHLRWTTPAQNAADKFADGTQPLGERNYMARLTLDQVKTIRHRWAQGETVIAIAKDHMVHRVTIHDVVARRTWKWA